MSFSEGEAILEKILENTPYTGIYDEFPEEEKEVKPSPDQQEEIHATESEIQSNPSNDLVVKKSPTKGTQTTLEDDEPNPPMFPFEIEDGVFEDFGNASIFPLQVKPLVHSIPFEDGDGLPNNPFLIEHIKGLLAIMSHEWLVEIELSTEVARITTPLETFCWNLKGTTIEAYYSPTVGMNIILKAMAEEICPNESLIPSYKLLRTPSGVTIESSGVIRTIMLCIRGFEYFLDFHIYDIPNTSLLIGVPLGTIFQERPKQSLLNLKLGNSTIHVSLARSHNAIVEPKPKEDPIEEVLVNL